MTLSRHHELSRGWGCSFVERFETLLERVHKEDRDVIVSSPELSVPPMHTIRSPDRQQKWQVANMALTSGIAPFARNVLRLKTYLLTLAG